MNVEEALLRALEEAWASYVAGSYGIGAVIIGTDGNLRSAGRNLIQSPRTLGNPLFSSPIAHAELNALGQIAGAATGSVLISTLSPCVMCTAAASAARIERVHYAGHDPGCDDLHLQPQYAGAAQPATDHAVLDRVSILAELMPLSRSMEGRGTGSRTARAYRGRNPALLNAASELAARGKGAHVLGNSIAEALEVISTHYPEVTPTRAC